MEVIKNRFSNLYYLIIISLPSLFLLANKFSYITILSFILLAILSFFYFLKKGIIASTFLLPLKILIIIFLYMILSYLFSGQDINNLFSYNFLRYDGSFFFCYLPFFIFGVPFLKYRKASEFYFNIIFFIFLAFSVFGLIEYLSGDFFLTVRIDSIGPLFVALNNAHNATGSAYAIIAIFALTFLLMSERRQKPVYLIILIFYLISLLLTKSRGSLLAFFVAAVILLVIYTRSWKKLIIALSVLLIFIVPIFFLISDAERLRQFSQLSEGTIGIRLSLWAVAINLISKSPLFGIGFGRYNDFIYYQDSASFNGFPGYISFLNSKQVIYNDTHAHNSYLQFTAELGIIGTLLIVVFWLVCILIIIKSYKRYSNGQDRIIMLSALSGIITLLILSLTEHYMSSPTAMLIISVTTSLAIGISWENKLKLLSFKELYENSNST